MSTKDTSSAVPSTLLEPLREVHSCNTIATASMPMTQTTIQSLPTPPTSPIDTTPKKDSAILCYGKRSYSTSFGNQDSYDLALHSLNNDNSAHNVNKRQKIDLHRLSAYLTQKHSSPNLCDGQFKRSLLNWACFGQSIEAVQSLLMNAHLDINLRSGPQKTTALHEACSVGFVKGVELLLTHPEIDINARTEDYQGLTPVHMAVQTNQLECLRLLLAAGARVDLFARDTGRLPVHTAVLFGHQQCVSLILSACYQHQQSKNVEEEICRNNPKQLDMLWTPNQLDQRNTIEMAIVTGFNSTLQLLLDYDSCYSAVKQEKKEQQKPQPLHQTKPELTDLAIEWNRIEVLRLLIKRGCIVTEMSLLKAVQQRKIDMVRELVTNAKVDPCSTSTASTIHNKGYNAPLLYAANHGFLDMVPLLLTLNTSKDCIRQALLLASSIGLRDQLGHIIVHTLKSLSVAAKKSVD